MAKHILTLPKSQRKWVIENQTKHDIETLKKEILKWHKK